ncbi:MAG: flagellar hook basal-body protein [Planctomycetota bacterium]
MADYAEIALTRSMSFLAETQAAISNNLANVDSTGYKRRVSQALPVSTGFASELGQRLGSVAYQERVDWSSGSLTPTGEPLHIALQGDGFLLVQNESGQQYLTRNGAMQVTPDGRLVNSVGEQFLDPDGAPISLSVDAGLPRAEIKIAPDGSIAVGDLSLGQLGLFAKPEGILTPVGQSRYRAPNNARPALAPDTRVSQSNLERSNVDALTEMVHMITVQRGFDASSRALMGLGNMKTQFIQAMNS